MDALSRAAEEAATAATEEVVVETVESDQEEEAEKQQRDVQDDTIENDESEEEEEEEYRHDDYFDERGYACFDNHFFQLKGVLLRWKGMYFNKCCFVLKFDVNDAVDLLHMLAVRSSMPLLTIPTSKMAFVETGVVVLDITSLNL